MSIDFISFTYAASVVCGGIVGYMKAGSIPSLVAGVVFGTILSYGAYQTSQNPNNYFVSCGTSAVLGGIMAYRSYNSGRFIPGGIVAFSSLIMVIRFLARYFGLVATKMVKE